MRTVKAILRGAGRTPPVTVLATSQDGHALVREVGPGNPMGGAGVTRPYVVSTQTLYAHGHVQGLGARFTLWGVPDYTGVRQVPDELALWGLARL